MVDGHIATATTRGDNYHLDLDGILYLGKKPKHYLVYLTKGPSIYYVKAHLGALYTPYQTIVGS